MAEIPLGKFTLGHHTDVWLQPNLIQHSKLDRIFSLNDVSAQLRFKRKYLLNKTSRTVAAKILFLLVSSSFLITRLNSFFAKSRLNAYRLNTYVKFDLNFRLYVILYCLSDKIRNRVRALIELSLLMISFAEY